MAWVTGGRGPSKASRLRRRQVSGSDATPCGNGHTGPVADMRVSGKPPHPDLIYRALTLTRPRSQAADEADNAIASRLRGLAPFGLLIDEERWG